jgi:hypothetical protein
MLEVAPHREVASTPETLTQLGRHLALHEAARPGGKEAIAAKLVKLGEDRHDGIAGGLNGEIVQIAAGWMRQGQRSPRDLEASLP